MESQLTGFDAIGPWRTRAILAAGVAAVELLLLLFAGVALFGGPLKRHARESAAGRAAAPAALAAKPKAHPRRPAPARPLLSRRRTTVLVLNGNGVTGAAGSAATRVGGRGYTVAGATNASRNDFSRSIVMYRRGFAPEAKRLARDLGVRIVGPLDGLRVGELRGAKLALIVGRSS